MTRARGALAAEVRVRVVTGVAGRAGAGAAATGAAAAAIPGTSALILGMSCSRTESMDSWTDPTFAGLVT